MKRKKVEPKSVRAWVAYNDRGEPTWVTWGVGVTKSEAADCQEHEGILHRAVLVPLSLWRKRGKTLEELLTADETRALIYVLNSLRVGRTSNLGIAKMFPRLVRELARMAGGRKR